MDTTEAIAHISLCAGYGGIDLGLSRAIPSLRTVAFSEIEAFACANLVAKMEAGLLDCAPIWTNLKTFPYEQFYGRVDILSGGYPCQPFSAAGKRLGTEDPRHLWPFISEGIRLMRPKMCFFENVEGHISLGLREVISDLEELGYKVSWGIFSAREVGAPHQRKRVFILAYDQRQRIEELSGKVAVGSKLNTAWDDGSDLWPSRPGEQQHAWEPPRVLGNAGSSKSQGSKRQELCGTRQRSSDADRGQIRKRQAQPSMGRDSDGTASGMDDAELHITCDNRTDELRLLGNGVVPATAERAFRTLLAELIEI